MRDLTLDEILVAKTSFERLANDGGITITSYRADNSRFADKASKMQSRIATKALPSVASVAIIKTALSEEKSRSLL